jgi:hypothetical protein
MFLLVVTGCGSSISGPTTEVEWKGITATLPGESWKDTGETTVGPLTLNTWDNADKSLIFRVAFNPDEFIENARASYVEVNTYLALMNYPENTLTDRSTFNGYRAIRMETIYPDSEKEAYHMVDYAFVSGFIPYYVGAGAKAGNWRKGGSETVEAILREAKIGK